MKFDGIGTIRNSTENLWITSAPQRKGQSHLPEYNDNIRDIKDGI